MATTEQQSNAMASLASAADEQNEREVSRKVAERYRKELADWYGKDAAEKVKFAEAFEICEYGQKPSKEQLAKLFPFFTPTAAAANR